MRDCPEDLQETVQEDRYAGTEKTGSKKESTDEEKALSWLSKGAIPTDTVRSILSNQGIMKKYAESKNASKKSVKKD